MTITDHRFDACLPRILSSEGGFVDDPADPGGATSLGVTIGSLSAWLGRPATKAEVRALTPATVAPIYLSRYWKAAACDQLPAGVDLMVFDIAVNSGPSAARRMLQKAVGASADGVIGPATLAAVRGRAAVTVINDVRALRESLFRSLPTFGHFGKGWMSRLNRVTGQALADAGYTHA